MSRWPLLVVPLLALSGSGCVLGALFSSVAVEDTVEQERTVPAFDRIHVTDGMFVVVNLTGGESSVRVIAKESDVESVETTVVNGTLVVSVRDDRVASDPSLGTVVVHTERLRSVAADASAAVDLVPGSHSFDLEHVLVADNAEVYLDGLADADSLRVEVSAGARVGLAGKAEHIDASFVGDAYGEIRGVGAARLDVHVDERSEARVLVTSELRGTVSGGSSLHVSGSPPVHEVTASGGGQVVYE